MHWDADAEAAIQKVPFFVRKRVKRKVEDQVAEKGRTTVTLADVTAAKQRFLTSMDKEVAGFQVASCFGPSGCPNRAVADDGLAAAVETILRQADLRGFLQAQVKGPLKFHHEFRVTIADCPNACSQPQIRDIGIIGACLPDVTGQACNRCEACVTTCHEKAIELAETGPVIDQAACLACGQCVGACPTGTLAPGRKGYRVQVGGKLGRHPQLARELPGLYAADKVLAIVQACLDQYKAHSRGGQRFGEILTDERLGKIFACIPDEQIPRQGID